MACLNWIIPEFRCFFLRARSFAFLLLALVIFPGSSPAASFTLHDLPFGLAVPKGWASVLPNENNLILQGSESAAHSRPVVFISNTLLKGIEFNSATMQVRIDSYTEGRRKYIRSKGGMLLGFTPYSEHRGKQGAEFHSTGVDYRIGREIYHERSSFISCHGSTFHLKTLDFGDPERSESANTLGRSFQCAR